MDPIHLRSVSGFMGSRFFLGGSVPSLEGGTEERYPPSGTGEVFSEETHHALSD